MNKLSKFLIFFHRIPNPHCCRITGNQFESNGYCWPATTTTTTTTTTATAKATTVAPNTTKMNYQFHRTFFRSLGRLSLHRQHFGKEKLILENNIPVRTRRCNKVIDVQTTLYQRLIDVVCLQKSTQKDSKKIGSSKISYI